MTTQTTTIQPSPKSVRTLIGAAAASLAVLGGALLWQGRPTSETATPATSTTISRMNEGAAPLGGLAEQYREAQETTAAAAARVTTMGGMAEVYREERAAAAAVVAAPVTTRGGMAEFYAEQAPVATTAPVTTLGGLAERYGEQQAAVRSTAAQLERMGGMAELYREQTLRTAGER